MRPTFPWIASPVACLEGRASLDTPIARNAIDVRPKRNPLQARSPGSNPPFRTN